MLNFCEDQNLIIASYQLLPKDSYTFVSASWGTDTWLDHVVTTEDFNSAIVDMSVCYNITDEDHIPATLSRNVELIPSLTMPNTCSPRLIWESISDNDCVKYASITDALLQDVTIHGTV